MAASEVADRLAAAGFTLPAAPAPFGRYAGARREGELIWIAGHTDRDAAGLNGTGPLEPDADLAGARRAAAHAAVNLIAAAAGVADLDDIEGALHLRGYVAATARFARHPEVIDGASEVLELAFGSPPPHTRAAIGVSSLPGGALVELEAVLVIRAR